MTSLLAPAAPEGETVDALAPETLQTRQPGRVPLEEILPTPVAESQAFAPARPTKVVDGLRTARVTGLSGLKATVVLRGRPEALDATVAPEVDPAVVADAMASGDSVLVELAEGERPLVVGVLHTRRPREIRLKATTIQIEGEEEVLLRAGRGALRIRADGDIEVVGSRISAASRGLFRIVGRLLRLN
jgi:hypothetical protein